MGREEAGRLGWEGRGVGRDRQPRRSDRELRLIRESRVGSTRFVGEAIARATRPPRAWLQAGTATIYSHRLDAPNDEVTGILGGSEPDAPDGTGFDMLAARVCILDDRL